MQLPAAALTCRGLGILRQVAAPTPTCVRLAHSLYLNRSERLRRFRQFLKDGRTFLSLGRKLLEHIRWLKHA